MCVRQEGIVLGSLSRWALFLYLIACVVIGLLLTYGYSESWFAVAIRLGVVSVWGMDAWKCLMAALHRASWEATSDLVVRVFMTTVVGFFFLSMWPEPISVY